MHGAEEPTVELLSFLKSIPPLIRSLRERRRFTDLQVGSISVALRTLNTFLTLYKEGVASKAPASSATRKPVQRNSAAMILGRLGGLKGGRARAKKLSPRRRVAIARLAAKARWAHRDGSKI